MLAINYKSNILQNIKFFAVYITLYKFANLLLIQYANIYHNIMNTKNIKYLKALKNQI